MKFYKFKIIDSSGKKFTLTKNFQNKKSFYNYLKTQKFSLISYKIFEKKLKISKQKILTFTEEINLLLKSGITIIHSLEIFLEKEKNSDLRYMVTDIIQSIKNGKNIYESFKLFDYIFGETYLTLLLIGEETGNLNENLEKICINLKLAEKIKSKLKEALFYPTIVLSFTFLLLFFMMIYIFPNFILLFENSNIELPFITRMVIKISNNFICFLFILFSVPLLITLTKSFTSKKIFENLLFKIPILNTILKKFIITNFCLNFSIMLKSGIHIIPILSTLKLNSNFSFFEISLERAINDLKRGKELYEAFSNFSLLSQGYLNMISIGEKSGTLDITFDSISTAMQKDLETYLFKLTTLFEPILIIFLGIIVGIISIALYLPIFSISETIF